MMIELVQHSKYICGSLTVEAERQNMGEGTQWSMIALGDIGFSGIIGEKLERGVTVEEIFSQISPILRGSDYVIANLETPLLKSWTTDKMFAGDIRGAKGLANAGIDMLHLASNHMLDYGPQGFSDTICAVQEAGIEIIGAGGNESEAVELTIKQFGDLTVGWLAAGHTNLKQPLKPRFWELNPSELIQAVEAERDKVDLLIVSLHWGPMLVDYPYKKQCQTAHQLVDVGASAVIMHHAHVLQGVELYKGVPICYNLGNCLFDPDEGLMQQASNFTHVKYEHQMTGAIFKFTWSSDKFKELLIVPIHLPSENVGKEFRIEKAKDECAQRVLYRLDQISEDLTTDFTGKLQAQLRANLKREIKINLNLALKRGQLWRLWYLFRQIKPRHFKLLLGKLLSS